MANVYTGNAFYLPTFTRLLSKQCVMLFLVVVSYFKGSFGIMQKFKRQNT